MSEYRPRRDDHLIEPLLGGLVEGEEPRVDQDEPSRAPKRLGHVTWILVASAAVAAAWLLR